MDFSLSTFDGLEWDDVKLNPTDNDTHQYYLGASNSSTAIGNTAGNSAAITSMRSAEQTQDKNQQSTMATQVSTSHRNPSREVLRLKIPSKYLSTLPSVSTPQPGAAGRREQPETTNKSLTFKPNPEKTSSLKLEFGPPADGRRSVPVTSLSEVTTNKAAAMQSSNGQSLQIPPQDNPRLSGGLVNAIKTFRTTVRLRHPIQLLSAYLNLIGRQSLKKASRRR